MFNISHPYPIDPAYRKKVAYFCMEFGIHQALKTYAGGLGFLAGSYLRGAYELKQNVVGIGILWKFGYYDQERKQDQTMEVAFREKQYGFLEPTGIKFTVKISGKDVWATAWYLAPGIFRTAPLFLLSTDLPENDYLARTIVFQLYDANPETKIAAAILLGDGGAKLLDALSWAPDIYHLNESHALPLAFHLYKKYKDTAEVRKRLVFTNHTPESGGNPHTSLSLLEKMDFFCDMPLTEVKAITQTTGDELDHTLTALRLSGKANAVSAAHLNTLKEMWRGAENICELISITNAQDFLYWHDDVMYNALQQSDDEAIRQCKQAGKKVLFDEVADQCGKLYDSNICTLVFAKRFTGYKRPDLLLYDMDKFERLVTNKERPLQIIWAGKPYPVDYAAVGIFDKIVNICKKYKTCSILTGYELKLSKLLKAGADIWLNTPRLTHEASGTSGMTAAMNGAVNVSIPDGWFAEFAHDKVNSFVIPPTGTSQPDHVQDEKDAAALYQLLETEVLPMFYDYPQRWLEIMKNSLQEISPAFDSTRMVKEYYTKLYE
jgi:starch phosphorylase